MRDVVRATAPLSGPATLATLSAFHGVPVTVPEIGELLEFLELPDIDLATFLAVGRTLGFESIPMEGGYDDLPDVTLPMAVVLKNDGPARYGMLFEVGPTEVTFGDPVTGVVKAVGRDEFSAMWTGDVVQLTPNDEERAALRARLVKLRDPRAQLERALGWVPPYGRRIGFVVAAAITLMVGGAAMRQAGLDEDGAVLPAGIALALAVTGCLLVSLWSWLVGDTCASCSKAGMLVGGVPVAEAGVGLYAGLLGGLIARETFVGPLLGVAVGTHGALVLTLVRAKMRCIPCFTVAGLATLAAVLAVARGDASPVVCGLLVAVAFGATMAGIPYARTRTARAWRAVAEEMGRKVAAEARAGEDGRVRVVVYKRKGCSSCAFYESVVRPGLEAELGESVAIEERDLGAAKTVAPLIVVRGAVETLFIGLPPEPFDDVKGAVVAAIEAAGAPATGELRVVSTAV